MPEIFKVGKNFVMFHRLYGTGGTQPALRETLQCDDIVLKWQILFARVYKNTFDPTLQLHVY